MFASENDWSKWPARREFDRSNPRSGRTLSIDRPLFWALISTLTNILITLWFQQLLFISNDVWKTVSELLWQHNQDRELKGSIDFKNLPSKFKELRKMTKKLIHSSYLQYSFTEDEAITCNSQKMKNHCYCSAVQGIRNLAWWQSREIHKNTRSTAQFGRNLTEYMSVQHIWNLSGDVFCHKLANLSWNFVTETRKRPSTRCS